MSVEVRLPTLLRTHTDGQPSIAAEGATVGAVFDELIGRFPSLANNLVDGEGHLHKFVNVYVDDEDIRYVDGLATPVKDGQTIAILPAVAGG